MSIVHFIITVTRKVDRYQYYLLSINVLLATNLAFELPRYYYLQISWHCDFFFKFLFSIYGCYFEELTNKIILDYRRSKIDKFQDLSIVAFEMKLSLLQFG